MATVCDEAFAPVPGATASSLRLPGGQSSRRRDQTAKAAPPALANRRRVYCRQRSTPMIADMVRETTCRRRRQRCGAFSIRAAMMIVAARNRSIPRAVRKARFRAALQWLADAARMTYFTRARRPCRRTRRRKSCAAAKRLLHARRCPGRYRSPPCSTHFATHFADSPSPAAWALQPVEAAVEAKAAVRARLAVVAVAAMGAVEAAAR
ncbi:hypothetical protein CBM2625_B160091 [Cupriavidus taiwanensis]|nr:hypothetical protein CBM2625_B160091 [Cupriavidus taiwanensis]